MKSVKELINSQLEWATEMGKYGDLAVPVILETYKEIFTELLQAYINEIGRLIDINLELMAKSSFTKYDIKKEIKELVKTYQYEILKYERSQYNSDKTVEIGMLKLVIKDLKKIVKEEE